MQKKGAGILLYRLTTSGEPEVLLVHPGGPFWARKDAGAWSIPKGEFEEGENPLAAARREFSEELGTTITGDFQPLSPVKMRGGKLIYAWACKGDFDPTTFRSNTFEIEWPRGSGKMKTFPEIDKAEWFGMEEARKKINESQAEFLDQLQKDHFIR